MQVTAQQFKQAETVQKAFEQQFALAPDVMGIGLGLNAKADAPALNVQVRNAEAREVLPTTFGGLDVVVEVVGDVHAY